MSSDLVRFISPVACVEGVSFPFSRFCGSTETFFLSLEKIKCVSGEIEQASDRAPAIRAHPQVCSLSRAFENKYLPRLVDDLAKFTLCRTRSRKFWEFSRKNTQVKLIYIAWTDPTFFPVGTGVSVASSWSYSVLKPPSTWFLLKEMAGHVSWTSFDYLR